MAQFTVTTANDVVDPNDGKLSLREAVEQANATGAADRIQFAASVEGHSLKLAHGELTVTSDLVIDGNRDLNASSVTIDGNYQSRIFHIVGDTDLELAHLTLTHGQNSGDGDGGAVLVESGSLSLVGSTIRDSQASADGYSGNGGAVYLEGGASLSSIDSELIGNGTYWGSGGAIATGENATITFANSIVSNNGTYAGEGGAIDLGSGSTLTASATSFNSNGSGDYNNGGGDGGAIYATEATIALESCQILDNNASIGGGILLDSGSLTVDNCTIADNFVWGIVYGADGGGICSGGHTVIRNSTITNNVARTDDYQSYAIYGAGILGRDIYIANSIVTGNIAIHDKNGRAPNDYIASDIYSNGLVSNGRNILGAVTGDVIPGDRTNVSGALVFANTDSYTGGGVVSANGTVALLNSALNPALSGGDPLTAGAVDQIGTTRPLPAGSLPDIGAAELNQRTFSTSPSSGNDVLTGSAAANTISGLSLNDRISGLGGDDTLNGNDGSDRLDGGDGKDTLNGGQGSDLLIGGTGNDRLVGDTGVDLAFFGGSTKVVVDLGLGKAVRGGETDTLSGIEGAIGSSAADTFKGDTNADWFQGGLGRDVFTGGGGRDLYDFNAVADSKSGSATRDVITDFTPLIDKLDLSGIDADPTAAGNQAFRWIGSGTLDGPGELGFVIAGGNTIVQASTDADAAAEFQIQLTGIKALSAVDFFL